MSVTKGLHLFYGNDISRVQLKASKYLVQSPQAFATAQAS